MQTTEQLIEKYKAEMQKMISNAKPPISEQNAAPMQAESAIDEQPLQEQGSQTEPIAQTFPSFEPDREQLTRRIEEILAENSDVARKEDFPSNLSGQQAEDNIPTEPFSGQGDLVMQDDDIIMQSDAPSDTQTARAQIRPPMFTPVRPPLRPRPPMQPPTPPQPPIQPPLSVQPREVSFEDMAPPLSQQGEEAQQQQTADDSNETPQQMVSRVCIRGGAKAQYSPPANTGLALGTDNQTVPALSDTATLRVEVFAANRAIPIGNAMIRVRNMDNNELVAVMVTDSSGDTSRFELPAPDRNLSLQSASVHPFVNYLVDIRADGYIPQSDLRVQMFGGIESILPANMIPLEA